MRIVLAGIAITAVLSVGFVAMVAISCYFARKIRTTLYPEE